MELVLDRLTKQYKNKIAVDRVSFRMGTGVYGLLGANGAGKTTLMRMICGILKPTGGEVRLDGTAAGEEAFRDCLGYLPQDFGYYPDFTPLDFLLYMASLKGIPKKQAKMKALELLETVNLLQEQKKKIKTFSGGMKQRLGIAQALLNNPSVLILDEPTAGLDPKERVRFRNMIAKLGADRIVLFSTHIVSDVEYIANQFIVMKDGSIVHSGKLDEIIQAIKGQVWECTLAAQDAEAFMNRYAIVNYRKKGADTFLRFISKEQPHEAAVAVDATLEDLYLYYFSEDTGEQEKEGRK